jgi:flagellar biosynthesis chaperone FliJ
MEESDYNPIIIVDGIKKFEEELKGIAQMKKLINQHKNNSAKCGFPPDAGVLIYSKYLDQYELYVVEAQKAFSEGRDLPMPPALPASFSYLKAIK